MNFVPFTDFYKKRAANFVSLRKGGSLFLPDSILKEYKALTYKGSEVFINRKDKLVAFKFVKEESDNVLKFRKYKGSHGYELRIISVLNHFNLTIDKGVSLKHTRHNDMLVIDLSGLKTTSQEATC